MSVSPPHPILVTKAELSCGIGFIWQESKGAWVEVGIGVELEQGRH